MLGGVRVATVLDVRVTGWAVVGCGSGQGILG